MRLPTFEMRFCFLGLGVIIEPGDLLCRYRNAQGRRCRLSWHAVGFGELGCWLYLVCVASIQNSEVGWQGGILGPQGLWGRFVDGFMVDGWDGFKQRHCFIFDIFVRCGICIFGARGGVWAGWILGWGIESFAVLLRLWGSFAGSRDDIYIYIYI